MTISRLVNIIKRSIWNLISVHLLTMGTERSAKSLGFLINLYCLETQDVFMVWFSKFCDDISPTHVLWGQMWWSFQYCYNSSRHYFFCTEEESFALLQSKYQFIFFSPSEYIGDSCLTGKNLPFHLSWSESNFCNSLCQGGLTKARSQLFVCQPGDSEVQLLDWGLNYRCIR